MKYLILTLAIAFSLSGIGQTKTTKPHKPVKPKITEKTAAEDNNVATGIDPGIAPTQPQAAPDVFTYVDQMPTPGYDLMQYLSTHIHYPDTAMKMNIQGRVIVKFVIDEEGKVTNLKVLRGIGYGCDEEAIRVLKRMPPWKPGKQNGKNVKVYYNQPISFKLEG